MNIDIKFGARVKDRLQARVGVVMNTLEDYALVKWDDGSKSTIAFFRLEVIG